MPVLVLVPIVMSAALFSRILPDVVVCSVRLPAVLFNAELISVVPAKLLRSVLAQVVQPASATSPITRHLLEPVS